MAARGRRPRRAMPCRAVPQSFGKTGARAPRSAAAAGGGGGGTGDE